MGRRGSHGFVARVGVDHGVDASEWDGWTAVSFGLKIEQWGEQGTSLVRKRVTVGQIFRGISRTGMCISGPNVSSNRRVTTSRDRDCTQTRSSTGAQITDPPKIEDPL